MHKFDVCLALQQYLIRSLTWKLKCFQVGPEDEDEEDGSAADIDAQRKGKCVVLKTSTRQTIFLPVSTSLALLAPSFTNFKGDFL